MLTFHSLVISISSLILLLTKIDALQYRSVRQTTNDVCPNLNGNSCNFVTCENGGVCIEDPTTVDCFKCQCTPGYTGKICDTSIVTLPPSTCNPECQNGGRCVSNGANYVCDCTGTGYTGTICTQSIIIDPCTSSPCQNGGQCSWNGQTMSCLCVNGYTGSVCQIAPVPCAATPCENGGKCELITGNTYGCACPQDFTGTLCETSIITTHPCVTMPALCQNGGVCTMTELDYLCKCAAGWSGTNCQTRQTITSCNPDPCGAHGTCFQINLPIGPTVYCNCENQWTGKYCDVNMDETCPAGYCLSGGTCRMNGNIPYCDCPPLYTGQQCEMPVGTLTTITTMTTAILTTATLSTVTLTAIGISTISPGSSVCSPNPCYNGGACYPSANSFICFCKSPFVGTWCETIQTATMPLITTTGVAMTCTDQPCKNGGTCVPIGTSYSCFCGLTSIYTGKNCDSTTPMPIDECPLNCAPGRCIFSGNAQKPYACLWNGVMRPPDGTTG